MNVCPVMKYRVRIAEGRIDARGPVRGISISKGDMLGWLSGFGLIHASLVGMLVHRNSIPLYLRFMQCNQCHNDHVTFLQLY